MRRAYSRGGDRVYSSGSPRSPGTRISAEDYPFQGLDIEAPEYDYPWLKMARWEAAEVMRPPEEGLKCNAAGWWKTRGELTPFGTAVAELKRRADGMNSPGGWDQAPDAWQPGDSGDQSWT